MDTNKKRTTSVFTILIERQDELSLKSTDTRQSQFKKSRMSQFDQSVEESYSIGFGKIDNRKDIGKSKYLDGTIALMCNECGKLHKEEC